MSNIVLKSFRWKKRQILKGMAPDQPSISIREDQCESGEAAKYDKVQYDEMLFKVIFSIYLMIGLLMWLKMRAEKAMTTTERFSKK